jgi:uncharacterized protein YkwD
MSVTRRGFLIAVVGPWPLVGPGSASAADQFRDRGARIEERIVSLTNQQRNGHSLSPLEPSEALAAIARSHSLDMATRGYFGHRSPDGLRSADRIAKRGLSFQATGENLYMVRNGITNAEELARTIVAGWMDSRGHRENILEADYRVLGVGVVATSRLVLATQLFAG